ncbi:MULTISPECIES: hypothetical protein [unclassified Meiothermus]|uniref:hypothetical protein n=1 Tax=unclassified Meiothermus TaxID=370471 RepID=UPI000D7BF684|nr:MULTISPECIES: hypothetical protein [unclassified Meiothermus]PZA07791.1 hypothetical protein DNA98_05645 [Meiothermus sp. Pnk-1]RYM38907.1 hypothetical protein EWH23_04040 [Meiothermus sp. PNK-Is4]
MVNGRYYDWEHITIKLKGGTLVDVDSIEYSDEQKLNRKYGKGRKTRGYTLGNKQGSGKLSLMREEYERLIQDADVKAKGLYGIDPVNIIVSFDKGDGVVSTDTLEAVKFTKRSFSGIEQDTEGPTVELEFEILGDIITDGVPA